MRIVAVSYINTLPFLYGIQNSGFLKNYELELAVPSVCAEKLINGESNVGLIPVAGLPFIKDYQIITDYCIGAEKSVSTVLLLSNEPVEQLSKIYLDSDSLTSVNLVKILAKNHWKINPIWESTKKASNIELKPNEGLVAIGDKTFDILDNYKYCYDLATEWHKLTALPFVFAVWIRKGKCDENSIENLNLSLKFGVENIEACIAKHADSIQISKQRALKYYKEDLSYFLDENKRKAITLFLNYLNDLISFSTE